MNIPTIRTSVLWAYPYNTDALEVVWKAAYKAAWVDGQGCNIDVKVPLDSLRCFRNAAWWQAYCALVPASKRRRVGITRARLGA